MEVTTLTIGEICSRFSSGKNITAEDIHEEGEYPVYGGNGLRGYTDRYNFEGQCSIIGRQGAYCGNVRYFSGKGYMSDHAVVAVTNNKHDNRYFAYKLSLMDLGRFSGQAAQPGISVTKVAKLKVEMPSLPIQRRIASILSAYDNLIENNNRRIRLLEQMAENLYKEWFVRFRFPGHENVEMENGLPKGWKIVRLKDVIIEQPKSKVQVGEVEGNNGQYPFYTSGKNILKYNNYLVDGENILLNTGGIADVKYSLGKTHYSTDTWCIKAIKQYTLFLYLYLQEILPEINASYFEGAALKHLKKASFKKKKLMLPPSTLVEEFDLLVSVLYKEIFLLKQNTQLLSRQRDLLLPRLMSGKLEVNA